LWQRPTDALAREMLAGGLRATLTCVDPRVLPASFAGRSFDASLLADLPPGVDPCGEKGEFHTFAWDGPMFREPVRVRAGEVVERDGFVFADLLPPGSTEDRRDAEGAEDAENSKAKPTAQGAGEARGLERP
jgi:diphthamide synthase (EF-2-diphthine--ammonia ligase)